jgi:hypothetical protein
MPRPRLNPSDEQRKKVKMMAAVGVSQDDIARHIGVRSAKTLRKHFREELDRATVDANASIAGTLYNKAMSGDTPALKFWLACRAGWHTQPRYISGTNQPPPFVVGVTTGGPKS